MIGIMTALRLRKLLKNKKIDVKNPSSMMNVGSDDEKKNSPLLTLLSHFSEGDPVDDSFSKNFDKY